MRISSLSLLTACLLGSLAFGQGAGAGGKKTIAEQLREQSSAGPGFMQNDFLGDLGDGLKDQFGEKRSTEMLGNLRESSPSASDMTQLMNGKTPKSKLKDMLGMKRKETSGTQNALDGAVDKKDRKIFGGIMIVIIILDFDIPKDSEFCQQACGATDEMSSEQFDKLKSGNVSHKTIKDCFGFKDKEDQKFMQDILNRMKECGMFSHPMAGSLGMGSSGGMDPKNFPSPGENSPGYGEGFGEGMAGGLPFDQEMPACPFNGGNLKDFFGGGGSDAKPGDKPYEKPDEKPSEDKTDEGADPDK